MWFEKLTGFREESPDQVRNHLVLEGTRITSTVNGRSMEAGVLDIPTLSELRSLLSDESSGRELLTVEEIVADASELHTAKEAEGALFQVASQFNLLEMVSPSVSPEYGIDGYADDLTQGPACAIAAGAGTIFRNYFTSVNGQIGQSLHNQIDCLQDIGSSLGNDNNRLWVMKNGYALPTVEGLQEINERLRYMELDDRTALRGSLRIGLQQNTEVTLNDSEKLVTQAYCSALPVSYSTHPVALWRDFACLILDGAYEATLAAAVVNAANTGNRRVFLTLLGGGAFGNAEDWILSSLNRALNLFRYYPIDVKVVSYGAPNPRLREFL